MAVQFIDPPRISATTIRPEDTIASTAELFQSFGQAVTLLEDDKHEKSTGFYLNLSDKVFLVATTHFMKHSHVYASDVHTAHPWRAADKPEDVCLCKCLPYPVSAITGADRSVNALSLPPDSHTVDVGAPVYFVGFPFQYRHPIWHKGRISSKVVHQLNNAEITQYTVDGTALPGYSGSPLIHYDKANKKAFLIGVITSEAIDLNSYLKKLLKSQQGEVKELTNFVRYNLTTGVINATDIKICKILFDQPDPMEPTQTSTSASAAAMDLKGRPAYRVPESSTTPFIACEWRPRNCQGGGPRGLTIVGNGINITYKFDVNPHDISKYTAQNFSKSHKLYDAAWEAFLLQFSQTQATPPSLTFSCYKTAFVGTPID